MAALPAGLRVPIVLALLLGLHSAGFASDVYVLDPPGSSVEFRMARGGVVYLRGRFADIEGVVAIDRGNMGQSSLRFSIPLASLQTGDPTWDEYLRGPDFFDVADFPRALFVSTRMRMRAPGLFEVDGLLSLHGVSHPVVFRFRFVVLEGPWQDRRLGVETSLTIGCHDYGIRGTPEAGGDEIVIVASLFALRNGMPGLR